jgi:hypothetical protein
LVYVVFVFSCALRLSVSEKIKAIKVFIGPLFKVIPQI